MPIELRVPNVGESITEVQIGEWRKDEGQQAKKDEDLVEIETEKATMELPAPASGTVYKVLKRKGDRASVGEVIGYLLELGEAPDDGKRRPSKDNRAAGDRKKSKQSKAADSRRSAKQPADSDESAEGATQPAASTPDTASRDTAQREKAPREKAPRAVTPAARRELRKHGLRAEDVADSTLSRLDKEDVRRHVATMNDASPPEEGVGNESEPSSENSVDHQDGASRISKPGGIAERTPRSTTETPTSSAGTEKADLKEHAGRTEEAVPMSFIRRRIAERLVEATQTAALLTTFNEIDMTAVMALRHEHRDAFQEKYGVKLGFMSFFVKASLDALKLVPQVNAEVRGNDIVYRNYADIGIAVGGGKGLVVPVLRNAERMSFAEIELAISDLARRAADNQLQPAELTGGTFTISNGGIYGSLLSTPIVNPPQSGILGLHAIQDRPVARDGEVVIRPMMYVALTYDHRLIDGREAVTFLRRIKDVIEAPSRMLLEI